MFWLYVALAGAGLTLLSAAVGTLIGKGIELADRSQVRY